MTIGLKNKNMKNKKTYTFYLDQKCTTWYRTQFDVEANSQEEATSQAIENYSLGLIQEEPWHIVDETTELMSPLENGGEATEELMYDGNIIKTNANEK